MNRTAQPIPTSRRQATQQVPSLTLSDHLHEIRTRLFWVLAFLLVGGSISFAAQPYIVSALMTPLHGERLVYLTPIGGFNFLFKISLYCGFILILPMIVYHLYKFLEPLMSRSRKRSVVSYSIASTLLAIAGASFAYFTSLPAALRFLTGFSIQNVTAMLTADSYLNFVITYLLGFAALFQIPLVLMIINMIKPLPPRTLMGFQRFVILGAFIVAAMISPTPDITNQAIMAVPIILMYQVGVGMVWIQNRGSQRVHTQPTTVARQQSDFVHLKATTTVPAHQPRPVVHPQSQRIEPTPLIDGMVRAPMRRTASQQAQRTASIPIAPTRSPRTMQRRPIRSIDGVLLPPARRQQSLSSY